MKVMKFGGTSVKDNIAINRVKEIIKNQNEATIIVVSAFSSVTNSLTSIIHLLENNELESSKLIVKELRQKHIDTAKDLNLKSTDSFINSKFDELEKLIEALHIIGEVSPRSKDYILSLGELLSSKIIFDYFNKEALNIKHIDSREIIKTNDNFGEAELLFEQSKINIKNSLNGYEYYICGGFIGSTLDGITTTLGRGGSDYTAAIIASAIDADKLEIWTDVDGILTSDPRMIKNAKRIKTVTYIEASELAYFGAKVLHPKTIYPAIKNNIPVVVMNTFKPESSGTLITRKAAEFLGVKAIAFRSGITVINIHSNRMLGAYGFLSEVFEVFRNFKTSVDLITTSEVSISLTIDNTRHLDGILQKLNEISKTEVYGNKAIISAVGEGIRNTAGIASRFFGVLSGVNVSMVSLGASEVNLGIVISENDLEKAVKLLHDEFFNNENNDIFEEIS